MVVEVGATRPRGVALIVVYKITKAVGQLVLAGVGAVLTLLGLASRLEQLAELVREHFTGVSSQRVASLIVSASSHLWLVIFALAFDGVLSSIEGWALYRGFRWAPWLVVLATCALLPFEVLESVRAVRVSRVLVLVVNLAIVVYLARHAIRHMRAERAAR